MKQSFYGLKFIILLLFLNGGSGLCAAWMTEVEADTTLKLVKDTDGSTFDLIDQDGNVVSGLDEQSAEELVSDFKQNQVETLQDIADSIGDKGTFLEANTPEAEEIVALEKNSQAVEGAIKDLKTGQAKIAQAKIVGVQSNINKYTTLNRELDRVQQIREFTKSVQKSLKNELDQAASDFQKMDKAGFNKKSVEEFRSKLLAKLNRVSDADYAKMTEFEKGKTLDRSAAEYAQKGAELRAAQREIINNTCDSLLTGTPESKAAAKQILAKMSIKASFDDVARSEITMSENIRKDTSFRDAENVDLQNVLKDQVVSLRQEVDAKISVDLLLNDAKKMVDGVEVSAIDEALDQVYDDVNQTAGSRLTTLENKISINRDALAEKMSIPEKISSSLVYRDGALAEVGRNFSDYVANDFTRDVSDGFTSVGQGIKKIGSQVLGALKHVAETLISGVLFMIPNIVQSGFLAAKQTMVILQTISTPFQFGDYVFQMASSCINFTNPVESIPVYFAMPVQNVDDQLSMPAWLSVDKSVSMSVTDDNSLTSALHSLSKSLFTFGTNFGVEISRYHVNEAAFLQSDNNLVATTYFAPTGYQLWGSVPATSSQFTSGQLIFLNNGLAFDGSSNPISTTGFAGYDAFPMLIPKGFDWHAQAPQAPFSPVDLKSFYAQMLERLRLSGANVKYIQYVNISQGSKGATGSLGLQSFFDAACLNVSGTSCLNKSETNNSVPCGLNNLFGQYQTGLSFNADGSVGSSVSDATNAKNKNLLEHVQPLFGWGSISLSHSLLNQNNFPGFTIDLSTEASLQGSDSNVVSDPVIQFGPEGINYQAFGCWIYLSCATPFAQALLEQKGLKKSDVGGPYVDYIIFLDANNNVVPLKVPVQTTNQGGKFSSVTLTFNPAIKYWTSIAAFNNQTGTALPMFADEKTGNPIKYDLAGNPYQDANLAGTVSSSTAPGTNVISAAIADFENNFGHNSNTSLGNLYAQFYAHQQAMSSMLTNGPFVYGNVDLVVNNGMSIIVPGSGNSVQAEIAVYSGATCYQTGVPDLLVAYDQTQQDFVTLPDSNAIFYSLITDIGYQVQKGSLVPVDFSNAPIIKTGTKTIVNQAQANTFYWLSLIEKGLETQYPLPKKAKPYNTAVQAFAQAQRQAWIESFDPSVQKQGINVGSLTCSMPSAFNAAKALAVGAYLYEVSPSPSAGMCEKDLFVISENASPVLGSLKPINAANAGAGVTLVSLVTGLLYDEQGNQLMDTSGVAKTLQIPDSGNVGSSFNKATLTYNAMVQKFDLVAVAGSSFADAYESWAQQYDIQMNRAMGPYTFGNLNVSIRVGDYAVGNYVYFDSASLHHKQTPRDLFVTIDPKTGTTGKMIDSKTQYLMSLVSGNVYDTTGSIVNRIASSQLLSMVQAASGKWGMWLNNLINQLQKTLTDRMVQADDEQAILDGIFSDISQQHTITMLPADAKQIIARLQPMGLQGLAVPYGLLKYDPVTQHFVHVSPLDATGSLFLYLFFNIGTDKKTGKTIGGIYHQGGSCVHVVKDVEWEVFSKQYGVTVDATTGKEMLVVPLTQPPFIMSDDAKNVTLGSNSDDEDLISSSSMYFPGGPVSMKKKYYLYYSTSMKAYFVYDVKNQRWISVDPDNRGFGHVYDNVGQPIADKKVVAVRKKASITSTDPDDMILLYENAQGATQGFINGQNYVNAASASDQMNWINLSGTGNSSITVTQSADGNTLTVTGLSGSTSNSAITYRVNTDYAWSNLCAVATPINAQGNVDATGGIERKYKKAQVVTYQGKISHLMYAGLLYKVTSVAQNTYTMVPVNGTSATIQVQALTDGYTGAAYFQVTDALLQDPMKYMYEYVQLTPEQMDAYQAIFGGRTTASTWPQPYGSLHGGEVQAVTVGNKVIEISKPSEKTHVLFAKNIATSASGVLDLKPVAAAQVVGVPQKPTENASSLQKAAYANFERTAAGFFANVSLLLQSSDHRFFVEIPDASQASESVMPTFSYVSNGAYVDLYTGVLYSVTTGVSLGYSLNLDDLLTVQNTVHVCVMQTKDKEGYAYQLVYRSPQVIQMQTAQVESIANNQTVTTGDVKKQFNDLNQAAAGA